MKPEAIFENIFLVGSVILMLHGTFSTEQVSIEHGELSVVEYTKWGTRQGSSKKAPLQEIYSVDVSLMLQNCGVKGGTPYSVKISTKSQELELRSYVSHSLNRAKKYRDRIRQGAKNGAFYSRRLTNVYAIYASLVCLAVWVGFRCRVLHLENDGINIRIGKRISGAVR